MAKKRFSEEQIVGILREGAGGAKTEELCRKYNVSGNTFYRWRAKYADMEVSDVRRLKMLEDENRRLKHIVADLTLDNKALKYINSKNW